jgi:transposase-like protein
MTQKPEILDELLKDCKTPRDVESLYSQLLQRMINRSLEAEMDVHLGYGKQVKSASDEARSNTRNRRIFPNDEAALKAMYLAIQQASRNWKQIHHWKPALQMFQIQFGEERVPLAAL